MNDTGDVSLASGVGKANNGVNLTRGSPTEAELVLFESDEFMGDVNRSAESKETLEVGTNAPCEKLLTLTYRWKQWSGSSKKALTG